MVKSKKLFLIIFGVITAFIIVFVVYVFFRYPYNLKSDSYNNLITNNDIKNANHINSHEIINLGHNSKLKICAIIKESDEKYYIDIEYDQEIFDLINDNYSMYFAYHDTINYEFSNTIENKKIYMVKEQIDNQSLKFNQIVFVETGNNAKVVCVVNIDE